MREIVRLLSFLLLVFQPDLTGPAIASFTTQRIARDMKQDHAECLAENANTVMQLVRSFRFPKHPKNDLHCSNWKRVQQLPFKFSTYHSMAVQQNTLYVLSNEESRTDSHIISEYLGELCAEDASENHSKPTWQQKWLMRSICWVLYKIPWKVKLVLGRFNAKEHALKDFEKLERSRVRGR